MSEKKNGFSKLDLLKKKIKKQLKEFNLDSIFDKGYWLREKEKELLWIEIEQLYKEMDEFMIEKDESCLPVGCPCLKCNVKQEKKMIDDDINYVDVDGNVYHLTMTGGSPTDDKSRKTFSFNDVPLSEIHRRCEHVWDDTHTVYCKYCGMEKPKDSEIDLTNIKQVLNKLKENDKEIKGLKESVKNLIGIGYMELHEEIKKLKSEKQFIIDMRNEESERFNNLKDSFDKLQEEKNIRLEKEVNINVVISVLNVYIDMQKRQISKFGDDEPSFTHTELISIYEGLLEILEEKVDK